MAGSAAAAMPSAPVRTARTSKSARQHDPDECPDVIIIFYDKANAALIHSSPPAFSVATHLTTSRSVAQGVIALAAAARGQVLAPRLLHGRPIMASAPWDFQQQLPRGRHIRVVGEGKGAGQGRTCEGGPGPVAADRLAAGVVDSVCFDVLLADFFVDGDVFGHGPLSTRTRSTGTVSFSTMGVPREG